MNSPSERQALRECEAWAELCHEREEARREADADREEQRRHAGRYDPEPDGDEDFS